MRTTLSLDDDIFSAARSLAHQRNISLGRAVSDLARRGLQGTPPPYGLPGNHDLPCFSVKEGSPIITPEMIAEAEDEIQ